jgi:hypothetical protein
MTQETLKLFRLLVPGILIVLLFLPFLQMDFQGEPIWKYIPAAAPLPLLPDWIKTSLVIAVTGALYYVIDVRGYFLAQSMSAIHDNIKNDLLQPFERCAPIAAATPSLRKGRILLDIFYSFIDNDETLKARATNVRFNGLILSSAADLAAVSSIGFVAYFVTFLALWSRGFLFLTVVCGVTYLITTTVLMPKVTKRHIALGDEQLAFIRSNYFEDLKTKLMVSTRGN